jgi:type II secretory pathway pseudopilin PulG
MIELLIVIAILSILAALAVPRLMRARVAANEAGAIASLRVTAAAQKAYNSTCGRGHYAASFLVLGTSGPAGAPAFISDDLGLSLTPTKAGYTYGLGPGAGAVPGPLDCNGTATRSTYYASAVPVSHGWTGTRSFAVNADSVIWEIAAAAAPAEPFAAPATPIN